MFAAVRASRDVVVGRLAARDLEGMVGPTSASGWTGVWAEDDAGAVLRSSSDCLLVVETVEEHVLTLVVGGETFATVSVDDHRPPRGSVGDLARGLCRVLGRDPSAGRPGGQPGEGAVEQAVDVLGRAYDTVDDLLAGLEEVLDLPAWREPVAARAVVVHRGEEWVARAAARAAGPTRLARPDEGWALLAAADVPGRLLDLALALSALGGSGARGEGVLGLWRGDDGSCGAVVVDGDEMTGSLAWGTGWTTVPPTAPDDVDAIARALVAGFRAPVDAVDEVRALLAAPDAAGDVVTPLAGRLGLPAATLPLLAGEEPSGLRVHTVVPASTLRVMWEAAITPTSAPIGPRWLHVVWAALTWVMAAVCLLMVVLEVAIIATDGAAVDEESAAPDEWWWLVGFALLGVVLVLLARRRTRRAGLRRRSGRASPTPGSPPPRPR